jgi:hypothetical protein
VCCSRVRGKIRFWGKTKHAEKKLSRDKQQSTQRDGTDKIGKTLCRALSRGVGKKDSKVLLYFITLDM